MANLASIQYYESHCYDVEVSEYSGTRQIIMHMYFLLSFYVLLFDCFNPLFIFPGFLTRSIVAATPSQQNSNTLMVYG